MYIEIRATYGKRQQPAKQAQQQYAHSEQNFPPLLPAHIPPTFSHSFANAMKNRNDQCISKVEAPRGELFTFAEVSNILFTCINELEKCTNKFDQLKVIANLLGNVYK